MRTVPLGTLVESGAPIIYGILMPGEHVEGGVPVVKVRDIEDGRIDPAGLLRTSREIDAQYKRSRLRTGDILLSIRGTTGRVLVVPSSLDGANITQDTARVRVESTELRDYVAHALASPFVQRQVALHTIGQAVKGINIASVRKLEIPLPSSSGRAVLVRVLDAVSRQSELVGRQLESKRRLKKALLQQLLTGKLRFPGTETVQWGARRIDEVASINPETLPETTVPDYEFRYVELSCVDAGKIVLPASPTRFRGAPSRARRLVRSGDLLFSTVRPNLLGFARVPYLPDPLVASTGFAVVRTMRPADAEFLYQSFYSTSVLRQVDARIAGTSFPAVSAADVGALRVAWPESASARERIGSLLDRVDTELNLLDRQLAAVRKLKRGLMQKLLTGELEVPAADESKGDEVHA